MRRADSESRPSRRRVGLLLFSSLLAAMALADDAPPEKAPSLPRVLLAVLTHRGGFASGLAHDHLIAAPPGAARWQFSGPTDDQARFSLELPVEELLFDDPQQRAACSERLLELGLVEDSLDRIADKSRAKIRKAALGRKQLDAATHPTLRAELKGLPRSDARRFGEIEFGHAAQLELEVHGVRVERPVALRFSGAGDDAQLEAVGEFSFSEFGIKPYSAALGAVKNQDRFHVYVRLPAAL